MKHLRHSDLSKTSQLAISASLRGIAIAATASGALAQFTDTNSGMPASAFGCVLPGDYDQDGNVDVLVMGKGSHDVAYSTIYRNVGGAFTDSGIPLLGLWPSSTCGAQSAAWGDFDHDGDLDLAMTGQTTAGVPTTRIYRNQGGSFVAVPGTFTGVYAGSVAWGDYDGDGDLDLLVTGLTTTGASGVGATRLYRNDVGVFTSVPHPFQNAYVGPVAWIDYDGDGSLDVLICGWDPTSGLCATLWRNQGGTFVDAGANLPGMDLGHAVWGDYDGDGDLDLLFGGNSNAGTITRLYRNDAGTLVDINAGMLPLLWSSAAWGDYDNDGDLDAMVIGYDPVAQVPRSILYRNDAGSFVDSGAVFHNVYLGSVTWFDADNDGDLDLLLFGNDAGNDILRLYRNSTSTGSPFCFGDGSGTLCPCGNNSAAGSGTGCLNSLGASGHLTAMGLASVGADSLVLIGSGMPNSSALYFQGMSQQSGGQGSVFGDGLRCAAGSVIRLGTKNNTSGGSLYPSGADPSIAIKGLDVAGNVRTYQVWYRNAASFCTASTYNLTNGLQVTWTL